MAEPGQYRAIINLKTFWIIRWLDEPMPGLGWEWTKQNPLPGSTKTTLPTAQALDGRAGHRPHDSGTLRFRGHDGHWQPISVT